MSFNIRSALMGFDRGIFYNRKGNLWGLFWIIKRRGKNNKGFLVRKRGNLLGKPVDNFSGMGLKKGGLTRVEKCGTGLGYFNLLSEDLIRVIKKLDSKTILTVCP
jgi:hypothetical protein